MASHQTEVLIKVLLNINCLSPFSVPAGSPSTSPSPITTTSHVARTSVPCTFRTSAGGEAATTASSPRRRCSPTGHGRLTYTSTSRTGAPRRCQPTARQPQPLRRHDWCRGEEDYLEVDPRGFKIIKKKKKGGGCICIKGMVDLKKTKKNPRLLHCMKEKQSSQKTTDS